MLSTQQITSNIEALEKQGASQSEIQEWLNSLRSDNISSTPSDIYKPEEKKEGLFEKIAGFIAPSEKKLASTISSAIMAHQAAKTMQKQADTQTEMTSKILAAYKAAPEGSTQKTQLLKILQDRSKGIGTGFDPYLLEKVAPSANKTGLQVAGELGGVALDLYGAGLGQKAVQSTKPIASGLLAGAKQGAIQGAKTGAGFGAAYGGLSALQEGSTDIKNIAGNALIGGGAGGLLGGAIGGIAGGIAGKIRAGKPEEIIKKRVEALQSIEDNNAQIRKLVSKYKSRGTDVKDILAQTDLLVDSVDNTGTLNTKNAISELNEFIKPQETVISKALAAEGNTISLNKIEKEMIDNLNNSELAGSTKKSVMNAIKKELAGLRLDADKTGKIPLSIVHNAKTSKYANINYLIPESKTADKLIARTLKEVVEKNTKSVDVKALNNELSQHFAVLDLLEKLDGKKVQGGKLGKYFAQTIGSVVGSHFGPLGAVAGAELGGRIRGTQMASTFGSRLGGSLSMSPAMIKTLGKTQSSKSLGNLKINQSTTIKPTKNAINNTINQSVKNVKIKQSKTK